MLGGDQTESDLNPPGFEGLGDWVATRDSGYRDHGDQNLYDGGHNLRAAPRALRYALHC